MPIDEQLLAAFLCDRSDEGFRALYDRHAPAMYALAFRLMGGREADAADVLQEAWTRAWRRLEAFRGESSLRTWLCGFVVNCCRERLHGQWSVLSTAEEADDLADQHAARGTSRDAALDLERALASLPAGYRAALVLHDIEGYTHREIAVALGIDEGTSKSQLSRGRDALRKRLERTGSRS